MSPTTKLDIAPRYNPQHIPSKRPPTSVGEANLDMVATETLQQLGIPCKAIAILSNPTDYVKRFAPARANSPDVRAHTSWAELPYTSVQSSLVWKGYNR